MPAKNIYHDVVVQALIADGWTITDDPLRLSFGTRELFVDLGAERPTVAAEKDGRKIAVEIQSFLNQSPVHDLENAVGQYVVYRSILVVEEPDRPLYMAVPLRVYETLLAERFGQHVTSNMQIRLLIFDEEQPRILQWIG